MRAEWRLGRGWTDAELRQRLDGLARLDLNFDADGARVPEGPSWRRYFTHAPIARERPGPPEPDGAFERAWKAVSTYHFSDPSIVVAHYDPARPLLGRNMLLELKSFGFHFLCGTRVSFERDHADSEQSVRGYRYDTLDGHFEQGSEWFLLTKVHATGEVWFKIQASWRPGTFPNWWSRLGFYVLGERYQLAWHRLAYLRLRQQLGANPAELAPIPAGRGLVHAGADPQDADLWILRAPPPIVKAGMLGGKAPPP